MKILTVSNIKCMGCVNTIEGALKEAGISSTVSFKDKKVVLKNDGDVNKAIKIIEGKGYNVSNE